MTMASTQKFALLSRALHWTMAIMVLAMLFIGIAMVTSIANYHWLVSLHRPLGIAILVLAILRLVNRVRHPAPPLPAAMPPWMRFLAQSSHWALYGLMLALPLVGWAMLSAAGYPIVLYGALQLPPILPPSVTVYAVLRVVHTVLAFLLFFTFIGHFVAAMLHALVFRDGVFQSMWGTGGSAGKQREADIS
jgi:cytochrome b561